jgi:hypothetical protein
VQREALPPMHFLASLCVLCGFAVNINSFLKYVDINLLLIEGENLNYKRDKK